MTSTQVQFTPQLIGQTEKTMNAILDRELAGRISEPEWVTMVLLAASNDPASHDQVIAKVARALWVSAEAAAAHIARLAAKGLVEFMPGPGSAVRLTSSGHEFVASVRKRVGEITGKLWGDLPSADLEVAGRVLTTVLNRAEAELNASS